MSKTPHNRSTYLNASNENRPESSLSDTVVRVIKAGISLNLVAHTEVLNNHLRSFGGFLWRENTSEAKRQKLAQLV